MEALHRAGLRADMANSMISLNFENRVYMKIFLEGTPSSPLRLLTIIATTPELLLPCDDRLWDVLNTINRETPLKAIAVEHGSHMNIQLMRHELLTDEFTSEMLLNSINELGDSSCRFSRQFS